MSLNYNKVKAYINDKLNEYKKGYDPEIFEGLTYDVSGGSFGACLISINGKYYGFDCEFVGNYNAIDEKISRFVVRSFDSLCERCYWREKEEKQKGVKYEFEAVKIDTKKTATTETITAPLKVYKALAYCYQHTNPKTRPYNNVIRARTWGTYKNGRKARIFEIVFIPVNKDSEDQDIASRNLHRYTFYGVEE